MMRRVVIVLALIVTSCARSLASQEVAALADRAGAAVWLVDSDGCGWNSKGSAFAIDKRHLVTNRHVVANDSSPMLRSRDGRKLPGKVIGSSEHPDLAVIETQQDVGTDLAFTRTRLGSREPLVVLGYPSPKHVFTASSGRVVSFQGTDAEPREAALTNVPIATGNSGGPGLLGDATVAGVVTLMRLRTSAAERVAIMFTVDAIRPTVQRFLDKPQKVLSTCGLGPDYVPPVPKTYEIKEPPPTAEPVVLVPPPTPKARTAAPATKRPAATASVLASDEPVPDEPTPTPVACPTGTVDTTVDEVTATEDPDEEGTWNVKVRGTVMNHTTSDVRVQGVYVHVDGDPPKNFPAVTQQTVLSPDVSSTFDPPEVQVHSAERPTEATAFASWRWYDADYENCPRS